MSDLVALLFVSSVAGRVQLEGSHLAKRGRDTRISLTRIHPTTACAAFVKESRMNFGESTGFDRKSEIWGTRFGCTPGFFKPPRRAPPFLTYLA